MALFMEAASGEGGTTLSTGLRDSWAWRRLMLKARKRKVRKGTRVTNARQRKVKGLDLFMGSGLGWNLDQCLLFKG
jgi:hypothetical protein